LVLGTYVGAADPKDSCFIVRGRELGELANLTTLSSVVSVATVQHQDIL